MIIEFEEKLLEVIDARIENASDDELFAGGYLRGHISLSVAACEEEGIEDIAEVKVRIEKSPRRRSCRTDSGRPYYR